MKRTAKLLVIVLALCALVPFIATANGGSDASDGPEPIKIGVIAGLSGPPAQIANEFKDGIEVRAAEVNEAGGLMVGGVRRPVEMIFEDSQAKTDVAISAAQKLITVDKVDILLGDITSSGNTMAIQEIAPAYKDEVFFLGGGTGMGQVQNILEDPDGLEYWYQAIYNNTAYASVVHQSLNHFYDSGLMEIDDKTIMFVTDDTDAGKTNCELMADLLEPDGWTVVGLEAVPLGYSDFYPQISKIKALDPSVIIAPIVSGGTGAAFVTQMNEQGLRKDIIGLAFTLLPEFRDAVDDELAEGLMGVPMDFDPEYNAEHAALVKMMKERLGSDVEIGHAQALYYSFAMAMFEGIEIAGSLEPKDLAATWATMSVDTPNGTFVYDPETHLVNSGEGGLNIGIAQIQNGVNRQVFPSSPGTVDYIDLK